MRRSWARRLSLGDIVLAALAPRHRRGQVNIVALRLPGDDEEAAMTPRTRKEAVKARARRIWTKIAEG